MILDAGICFGYAKHLSQNIRKDSCYFSLDVTNEVYLDQKEHKGQVKFSSGCRSAGAFRQYGL